MNQHILFNNNIFYSITINSRYGWQIDPFGASNVVHDHFGRMGFNATVIDRISYTLKNQLTANKSLEMIWQTNANTGADSEVCSWYNLSEPIDDYVVVPVLF